jgi:hypothetical protein
MVFAGPPYPMPWMLLRVGGFDGGDITTTDVTGLTGYTAITMDRSSADACAVSGGAGYKKTSSQGYTGTANFSLSASQEYVTATIGLWSAVYSDTVSGGAGYVRQSAAGSSGTSNFSLTSPNEARMLTIAIAPASTSIHDCCGDPRP